MNTAEIFKRLKIGLSIVVGFFAGKFAAGHFGHHASEFFIAFFGLGVIFSQALFWATERLLGRSDSTPST
ncbi:MAG TPA: hypothetical protein VLU73_11245 [Methylococcaceae bacterium]|nr:hypothetical protein [Methylococcaceae bacterium]